jgi:hypothetical protein
MRSKSSPALSSLALELGLELVRDLVLFGLELARNLMLFELDLARNLVLFGLDLVTSLVLLVLDLVRNLALLVLDLVRSLVLLVLDLVRTLQLMELESGSFRRRFGGDWLGYLCLLELFFAQYSAAFRCLSRVSWRSFLLLLCIA